MAARDQVGEGDRVEGESAGRLELEGAFGGWGGNLVQQKSLKYMKVILTRTPSLRIWSLN